MQEITKTKIINKNLLISKSISDTEKFAYEIAKRIKVNDIICLKGDLGTGKTVIAKAIGSFFHVNENITSPTFNIIKTYHTSDNLIKKIHHFDLYRIKNIDELIDIGFDDYIYDNCSIVLIEWPEIVFDSLNTKKIITIKKNDSNKLHFNENERIFTYEEYK